MVNRQGEKGVGMLNNLEERIDGLKLTIKDKKGQNDNILKTLDTLMEMILVYKSYGYCFIGKYHECY